MEKSTDFFRNGTSVGEGSSGGNFPQVELTYLRMRGRAELARFLLAAAGVGYVDERINGAELDRRRKMVAEQCKGT